MKVKFSVKDSKTLELQENASKGDIIDGVFETGNSLKVLSIKWESQSLNIMWKTIKNQPSWWIWRIYIERNIKWKNEYYDFAKGCLDFL